MQTIEEPKSALARSKTRSELPNSVRWQIIGAHKMGASSRRISQEFGISKSTILATIQRYKETGTAAPKKRIGRPKKSACSVPEASVDPALVEKAINVEGVGSNK
ncbi:uncharacterized protein SPPG_00144 [Spizellomyces punctatus DAOM BR117]|uniref:Insertion element IS150 protein InsJ-like helix-turn-helix domain-containing protein n=1 Tax=Spizellomyces punctatus (strain DAOM BR117) TaxID=645134 RepID=A0A0L0HU61_SPIPD|nr:uncharacterized protein SPPG_00144 [Spizellomyces punctatus DAOM BR117]KND04414.1 hypothetical protein SPPG_00144 [Spizellomyces punctatus DAOM BR117]|eukprot:XP_016612453.1 hypothetical protein SPPG_00144 [Spizellomyces punctatus DAOM BR117]